MADKFKLYSGSSKSRMHHIATDELKKIENYQKALKASNKRNGNPKYRFFKIEPADVKEKVWRQDVRQWPND
jgi:hypothetical protein